MSEIWKPHVAVAAVIEDAGRFLLVEEMIEGERVFNQPAGHLDPDESLLEAVIRETMEEAAVDFTPTHLVGVYLMRIPEKGRTYLRFAFCGELGRAYPERALDSEIIRTHWLTRAEIADLGALLRNRLVEQCIDDYLAGIRAPLTLLKTYGMTGEAPG